MAEDRKGRGGKGDPAGGEPGEDAGVREEAGAGPNAAAEGGGGPGTEDRPSSPSSEETGERATQEPKKPKARRSSRDRAKRIKAAKPKDKKAAGEIPGAPAEPRRRRRFFLFGRRKSVPEGLWVRCDGCGETVYNEELAKKLFVCPKCGHHFRLSAADRIRITADQESFHEFAGGLETPDPLGFVDSTPYPQKVAKSRKKSGVEEGIVVGDARIHGRDVVLGVMEFRFLGGSMGLVVGERVTRAAERAIERRAPLILFCASGGARMHEGAISLMQMGKTCAALGRLDDAGGFYLAVLCNPTTGGVTASFATTADIVLAEPGALIGFAGPRVIQQTIKQDLPKGFQTAEFLLQRGQVDRIVPRDRIRDEIAAILSYVPAAGGGKDGSRARRAAERDAGASAPGGRAAGGGGVAFPNPSR